MRKPDRAADAARLHGWRRAEWERRMDAGLCAHYGRCGAYHTFPCAGCCAAGELPHGGAPAARGRPGA